MIETKTQEVESVVTEQIETRDISPAVENTMKQMLRQMDVLTNTVSHPGRPGLLHGPLCPDHLYTFQVSILEQRLSMMESKFVDVMLNQNINNLQNEQFVSEQQHEDEPEVRHVDPLEAELLESIDNSIKT